MARARGLAVVFEILNRYETHQVRTVAEGCALLDAVRADNLKLLPDAYHMNIEEDDPAAALRHGAGRIGLYHAADSNRCGIGQGHTDFAAQLGALRDIGYGGPIILETNAPGPKPVHAGKGPGFQGDCRSAAVGFRHKAQRGWRHRIRPTADSEPRSRGWFVEKHSGGVSK